MRTVSPLHVGQQVLVVSDRSSGTIVSVDESAPYPYKVDVGAFNAGRSTARCTMSFEAGELMPASETPENFVTAFERDMGEVEGEIIARQAEFELHDATHCRECGRVAAGSIIAGSHVQACDSCIVSYVQNQISPMLAVA